jgi:hypothetical protein
MGEVRVMGGEVRVMKKGGGRCNEKLSDRTFEVLSGIDEEGWMVPDEKGVFWWRHSTHCKRKLSKEDSISVDHLIDNGFIKFSVDAECWVKC